MSCVNSAAVVMCILCEVLASEIIAQKTAELGYVYAEGIVSFALLTTSELLLQYRPRHIRRICEKCCSLFACIEYVNIDK